MKFKSLLLGLFFLLAGVVSLFLENTFYQYVDQDGRLHESLFLPFGVFAIMLGALCIVYFLIKMVVQFVRKRLTK